MSGSGKLGNFVNELYDQFLVCRLCSQNYRRPKTLSCLHSFCEACLEMHYDMEEQDRPYRFLMYTRALSCPQCHAKTELPVGGIQRLPDNFLVANLSEVINRRNMTSSRKARCEICAAGMSGGVAGAGAVASGGRRIASSLSITPDSDEEEINDSSSPATRTKKSTVAVTKCLDCVKLLCRSCADIHRRTKVTQQHSLFDLDVQKDVECKVHESEILRFYCEPCETCICVLCTFDEHRDHDVSSLVEGLERNRGVFERLMENCAGRITRMREQLTLIDRCETGMMRAEAQIRDSAIEAIAAVRRREKELMQELRDAVGERALQFVADKETLKENLRNVQTTFNMTEVMLKGTSIELLMVKKEMQAKLNHALDMGVEATPENLQRDVLSFCTEDSYRDCLQSDESRTSKASSRGSSSVSDDSTSEVNEKGKLKSNVHQCHNVEIQTDPVISNSIEHIANETNNAGNGFPQQPITKIDVATQHDIVALNGSSSSVGECKKTASLQFVSSEKELELISPEEFICPIEYVTPEPKNIDNASSTASINKDNSTNVVGEKINSFKSAVESENANIVEAEDIYRYNATSETGPMSADSTPRLTRRPSLVGDHGAGRSSLAQNWQNSCARRSSVVSASFDGFSTPPSTPGSVSGSLRSSAKGLFGSNSSLANIANNDSRQQGNNPGSNNVNSMCSRFSAQTSIDSNEPARTPKQPVIFPAVAPPRRPCFVSTGTGMDAVVLVETGTGTHVVSAYIDKETSTPHILTTNKGVSTENQEMVDKSTSTAVVDVAAAYRNVAATTPRQTVTVSRGTCTPKVMFALCSERSTSPVAWDDPTPPTTWTMVAPNTPSVRWWTPKPPVTWSAAAASTPSVTLSTVQNATSSVATVQNQVSTSPLAMVSRAPTSPISPTATSQIPTSPVSWSAGSGKNQAQAAASQLHGSNKIITQSGQGLTPQTSQSPQANSADDTLQGQAVSQMRHATDASKPRSPQRQTADPKLDQGLGKQLLQSGQGQTHANEQNSQIIPAYQGQGQIYQMGQNLAVSPTNLSQSPFGLQLNQSTGKVTPQPCPTRRQSLVLGLAPPQILQSQGLLRQMDGLSQTSCQRMIGRTTPQIGQGQTLNQQVPGQVTPLEGKSPQTSMSQSKSVVSQGPTTPRNAQLIQGQSLNQVIGQVMQQREGQASVSQTLNQTMSVLGRQTSPRNSTLLQGATSPRNSVLVQGQTSPRNSVLIQGPISLGNSLTDQDKNLPRNNQALSPATQKSFSQSLASAQSQTNQLLGQAAQILSQTQPLTLQSQPITTTAVQPVSQSAPRQMDVISERARQRSQFLSQTTPLLSTTAAVSPLGQVAAVSGVAACQLGQSQLANQQGFTVVQQTKSAQQNLGQAAPQLDAVFSQMASLPSQSQTLARQGQLLTQTQNQTTAPQTNMMGLSALQRSQFLGLATPNVGQGVQSQGQIGQGQTGSQTTQGQTMPAMSSVLDRGVSRLGHGQLSSQTSQVLCQASPVISTPGQTSLQLSQPQTALLLSQSQTVFRPSQGQVSSQQGQGQMAHQLGQNQGQLTPSQHGQMAAQRMQGQMTPQLSKGQDIARPVNQVQSSPMQGSSQAVPQRVTTTSATSVAVSQPSTNAK